jgi:outer membrane protein assembly factor BamB
MKRIIARNIAFISAIFMVTLSIMLITNYFQAKEVSPLQTQVIETLKQLNDQNSGNIELQEQIRQLDLMARKAYFLNMDQQMRGVYLLLGMLAVFIVCLRIYFAGQKNTPEKDLDPIDDWVIKTKARKYVGILATGLAAVALLSVVFSLPFMQVSNSSNPETDQAIVQNTVPEGSEENVPDTLAENKEDVQPEAIVEDTLGENTSGGPEEEVAVAEQTEPTENTKLEKQPVTDNTASPKKEEKPKVNSNAFRGNYSNGISRAQGIPVKWDLQSGKNIAWRTEIPLGGQSSPVINGNHIFITGANEQSRTLFCYDLFTGKLLWSVEAKNIPGSPAVVPKTSDDTGLASSTVSTNGKQVCAIFATGDLICTDMSGKVLWSKNLGVPDNHYGYASSLLILNNQLFIQYDNRNTHQLIALNTTNGNIIWSKERDEKITWSSPSIAYINKKPVLVLMGNPDIVAYNAISGEQLWKVKCLTGEVGASACSSNGIVFGASEYAKLVALNGTDGALLWESMDYLPEASSPVATATHVYVATSYGVVAAFDAKTGVLKKEHETNAEFYSSPMLAEGKIFLISNGGTMHIFSADNDFKLLDSFETGEKTFATPAFTDSRIVVRTEKSIYCVKAN